MPEALSPLAHAVHRLALGRDLTADEAAAAFGLIMSGEAPAPSIAALLMGLRVKGETAEEVAGTATALRAAMVALPGNRPSAVDTCGTGGGVVGTINISTPAAFVAAAAGVPVAKHGNRSFTSRCGSADLFEALGIEISLSAARAAEVLDDAGLVFLFAPDYHPAMRHVGPVRRELAVPTVMNLVGPLANPAGVRRQVLGVADRHRAPLVAGALRRLGAVHALVVHAEVGMDEISPVGRTAVWEVREGRIQTWEINPVESGVSHPGLGGLAGGDPAGNAARVEAVLEGHGEELVRDAVLLNAGAAVYVGGGAGSFAEGVERSRAVLSRGGGAEVLARLRALAPRP
jgi:anthranilate phosphoribosyltransferase